MFSPYIYNYKMNSSLVNGKQEKVRVSLHETRINVEEIAPPATSRTGLCIGEVSTYLPHRAKKDHDTGIQCLYVS